MTKSLFILITDLAEIIAIGLFVTAIVLITESPSANLKVDPRSVPGMFLEGTGR